MDPLRISDYAAAAELALPTDVWDYFRGGSGAERTLAANQAAYGRYVIRPRVLVDVSAPDLRTEILGQPLAFPVAVAPTAYQRLACPDGELATAAAAGAAGTLMVVSFFASQPLEDITAAATGPVWQQVYWFRERQETAALAVRAAAAGCQALVLTVDAPRIARRPRDIHNGFALPPHVRAANLDPVLMSSMHVSTPGSSALELHSKEQFDTSVTWKDLAWLKQQSPLPLVLKGIATAEDARLAVDHGADAIVVSNHGGRQLDSGIATLDALPEVVSAVAGRLPVLVDGGIRGGTDVFKALALGARAVLVGRPVVWGLAHSGEPGVTGVLRLLREELEETMVLAGTPRVTDITPSAVRAVCPACGGSPSGINED